MSDKKMKHSLKGYRIEGNIEELHEAIESYTGAPTTLADVISVLVHDRTNYVVAGCGLTLDEAFLDAGIEKEKCRLLHVFYSYESRPSIKDLCDFIDGMEKEIIFGYSIDCRLREALRIVVVYN